MANILVSDGDSITLGSYLFYPYPSVLPLYTPFTIFNIGVNGETIATMLANAPTNVDPKIVPGSGNNNIVVIWGGTNDFFFNNALNPTIVFNNLKSYCLGRKALGWKVLVVPMMSRTNLDVQKNAYNALIFSSWPTFADGLVSLPSTLMADGAYANTTYFGDGTHPNQFAMSTLIAPAIALSINNLMGLTASFVQTTADNFTRPNAPNLGPNWSVGAGNVDLKIVSNTAVASIPSGFRQNGGFYNASTLQANQYVEIKMFSDAGPGDYFGPVLFQAPFPNDLYGFFANAGGTGGFIAKRITNVYTHLVDFTTPVPAPGDVMRLVSIGNWLGAYYNGILIFAISDTAVTNRTVGGIETLGVTSNGFAIAGWSAGNVVISSTNPMSSGGSQGYNTRASVSKGVGSFAIIEATDFGASQAAFPSIGAFSTADYYAIVPNGAGEWKVQKSVGYMRSDGLADPAGIILGGLDCLAPIYPGVGVGVVANTFMILNGYLFKAIIGGTTNPTFMGFSRFNLTKNATTSDGSVVWTSAGKAILVRFRFQNVSGSAATPTTQTYELYQH